MFTIFATVGVINALNMSDGADGLAGGLSLIALLGMAYVADGADLASERTLLLLLAVVVVGFLLFNIRLPWQHRARVFMGDAGSMFLGFAITWFFISLSQGEERAMAPVAALWLLMIPLFDTVWLILWRFSQGRSPTSSDVGHLHHVLQMTGMGAATSVWVMLAIAAGGAVRGLDSPPWTAVSRKARCSIYSSACSPPTVFSWPSAGSGASCCGGPWSGA